MYIEKVSPNSHPDNQNYKDVFDKISEDYKANAIEYMYKTYNYYGVFTEPERLSDSIKEVVNTYGSTYIASIRNSCESSVFEPLGIKIYHVKLVYNNIWHVFTFLKDTNTNPNFDTQSFFDELNEKFSFEVSEQTIY